MNDTFTTDIEASMNRLSTQTVHQLRMLEQEARKAAKHNGPVYKALVGLLLKNYGRIVPKRLQPSCQDWVEDSNPDLRYADMPEVFDSKVFQGMLRRASPVFDALCADIEAGTRSEAHTAQFLADTFWEELYSIEGYDLEPVYRDMRAACQEDMDLQDPYRYHGVSRRDFMASRSALIRLAATMPTGTPARRILLASASLQRYVPNLISAIDIYLKRHGHHYELPVVTLSPHLLKVKVPGWKSPKELLRALESGYPAMLDLISEVLDSSEVVVDSSQNPWVEKGDELWIPLRPFNLDEDGPL